MRAVIGLGNPGVKYSETKHNAGFMLLDRIAAREGLSFRNDFRGQVAEMRNKDERIFFLKPITYMNLSGLAVGELIGYYKINTQNILVVHDDMDLPLGKIRLRAKGSAGGHNGLKSIIAELGSQDFWRLKIGVGRPKAEFDVVKHVLSTFAKEEKAVLDDTLDRAQRAVGLWTEGRGDEAMNLFNQEKQSL
jgi:PTH1 family peptidyl-tRNA hydrolase